MLEKINHVLCLKHGNKYSAEYVNKLYRATLRNCTLDFQFNCMTENSDGLDPGINIIALPDLGSQFNGNHRAWWYKPTMFRDDLDINGIILYVDLDVVIINNIDKFFTYMPGEFCICQDFNRYKIPNYPVLNTSLVKFESKNTNHIYLDFIKRLEENNLIGRMHGDQDFVTSHFELHKEYNFVLWPHDWAMSWKWEIAGESNITIKNGIHEFTPAVMKPIPEDLAIIVFHGKPNPDEELNHDIISNNWY